jgi:hypothetical protein
MTKVNLIAVTGITKYAKALNTIGFAASLAVDAALPSSMCATERTSIPVQTIRIPRNKQ